MSYQSLRDFIEFLKKQGDLKEIDKPIKTHLEMTEIQTRLLAKQGVAVLAKNPIMPDGSISKYPALLNLFGTKERVAAAMGINLDELSELGKLLAFFRQPEPPSSFKDAIHKMPLLKQALASKPKTIKNAPCQEIEFADDDIDLHRYPIIGMWPNEPAPIVTWPIVVTAGPSAYNGMSDRRDDFNLGIYRMQLLDKNKLIMRWLKARGGAQQFARWQKLHPNKPFPVAIAIGADPATIIAAVTPIPDNLSEYRYSGIIRKEPVKLVNCKTVPLKVPAHAEIIFEGHIYPNEFADEGPYGDHTGFYNDVEKFPVFTVEHITERKDAIFLSTFTGRPPDEPSILGETLNDVLVPMLQQQFPEIVDFYLPPEACSYRLAVVSMKKAYIGHAKRVMMGVWSFLRQFMYTKFVIAVDEDYNIRDWNDVIWAISTNVDPKRDTVFIENTPIDYLDFASPISGLGSKMGIDATKKLPGETNRNWGEKITMDKDVVEYIDSIWNELDL